MSFQDKLVNFMNGYLWGRKMEQDTRLKLFISYSHEDYQYITHFKKHITPLKSVIEVWSDHEILVGEKLYDKIDFNINDADIICLFISSNYFDSKNCMSEKERALELRRQKGVQVIPIILSTCMWLRDEDLRELLASPTDGNPVSKFMDKDEAWQDVCNGLEKVIEKELVIKNLQIRESFQDFLQDTEILTKAHSKKENVLLDDIFIWPELDFFNTLNNTSNKSKETISSETLVDKLLNNGKVIIAGDGQSGKTTLCKKLFMELRANNFVPVYVSGDKVRSSGKIDNKISKSFSEQYYNADITEIDEERIIPIIDDFHHAKDKEKQVMFFSKKAHCIIVVDDIFALNIKDETLLSSFSFFSIKELKN
jgi:hypothetical protein